MKINITYTGPNPKRLHYVLGFIQGHPFLPRHVTLAMNDWKDCDLKIDYTSRYFSLEENEYFIPNQEQVFLNAKNTKNWIANEYEHQYGKVYSVELLEKKKERFIIDRVFSFDIFESIFFHLTRYEEYYCDDELKDKWDMMEEKHQFLVRNKLYHRPIVDNLVEALLVELGIKPVRFKSKLTITHDIDVLQKFPNVRKTLRAMLGDFRRNKSLKSLVNIYTLYKAVKSKSIKDPYDTFDELFVSTDHRKIVYFMAGGTSHYDEKYDIHTKRFNDIFKLAEDRNYQLGIHPSYNSYEDYQMITSERKKLETITGKRIRTSRQHFLHFSFDETITALSDSGIYEDSTLGYQHRIGFRCGTAFTFLLYDLRRDRNSKVSETPMIIMDGALLEESGGDASKAKKLLSHFINQYAENSHLTINFHNTIFDPTRYDTEEIWNIYHSIIEKYN